jgi:hypothetical protein
MSLRSTNTIDGLGEDPETGALVLSLFDEADWDDVTSHWGLLCDKLDRYLAFLVSGEWAEHYPDVDASASSIGIVFRFQPPAAIEEALGKSQQYVAAHGFSLVWFVHE